MGREGRSTSGANRGWLRWIEYLIDLIEVRSHLLKHPHMSVDHELLYKHDIGRVDPDLFTRRATTVARRMIEHRRNGNAFFR